MNSFNLLSPYNSTIKFKLVNFPDSQPHVKIDMDSVAGLPRHEPVSIVSRMANANDLLLILFVKNALDYLEFERVQLNVSYLITARMDRVMLEGEPFSLKVIAGMLNQANFQKISIFDPHSEVTTALINRSYAIANHHFVQDALQNYFKTNSPAHFSLVSPDAGALKKIYKLAAYLQIEEVIECTKERDIKTGALTHFSTTADDLTGQTCFIVDDICDGGGTFAGNAKMLKEKGAEKVILIVSHGIFSKGTSIEYIDGINTTDSFRKIDGIYCFDIQNYITGNK
jgi:ribose-phosphate pyrophosphokinase